MNKRIIIVGAFLFASVFFAQGNQSQPLEPKNPCPMPTLPSLKRERCAW